jgi:hypothetical protein
MTEQLVYFDRVVAQQHNGVNISTRCLVQSFVTRGFLFSNRLPIPPWFLHSATLFVREVPR